MTKMRNHNLRRLTRGLLGAVLLPIVVIAPSANSQTARRSYTVNPSSVEQGNVYELTIKSAVCTSNDPPRTDLTAPADSGITIEVAVGVGDCTMVARIAVAGDAAAGTVPLRLTKYGSPWGTVDLTITGSVVREVPVDPQSGSTKPQPSRLEALLALASKAEPNAPSFETSGQTPLIVNWSRGPIRGESVWGTEFYWEGMRFCVLSINGVSVAVTRVVGKKTSDILILVFNRTNRNIDVVPSRFVLTRSSQKPKQFAYIPPEKIADKVARGARRSASWIALLGAFATSTSRTRSSTTGSVNGFVGTTWLSGNYLENTYSTTTRPDTQARNLAFQRGREVVEQGESRAGQILSGAFKANTLVPSTFMSGYVYFSRSDSDDSLVLQMPIGNYIFAMPFQR